MLLNFKGSQKILTHATVQKNSSALQSSLKILEKSKCTLDLLNRYYVFGIRCCRNKIRPNWKIKLKINMKNNPRHFYKHFLARQSLSQINWHQSDHQIKFSSCEESANWRKHYCTSGFLPFACHVKCALTDSLKSKSCYCRRHESMVYLWSEVGDWGLFFILSRFKV